MIEGWTNTATLTERGLVIFIGLSLAGGIGMLAHHFNQRWVEPPEIEEASESQESYIVSAVLGLLALLMGFTFALAVERYETRRVLVLQESNAIQTAYLRAVLLDEPDRARLSGLLVDYAENRLLLGEARTPDIPPLLKKNDALLVDVWAATTAALDNVQNADFSNALLESVNLVFDLDSARKVGRMARVPEGVFQVLYLYMIITAVVLGFVLEGRRGWISALFLNLLLTITVMLIYDIDRPNIGRIGESQAPMKELVRILREQPPEVFDRWREKPLTTSP